MATDREKEHAATAAVGLGLIAGGAQMRAKGLRHIDPVLRGRQQRYPEAARMVLGRKSPTSRTGLRHWTAGSVVGAAGAAPATVGILGVHNDRRRPPKSFFQRHNPFAKADTASSNRSWDPFHTAATGVHGALDANKAVLGGKKPHRSKLEHAAIDGAVLGASALGGQASRKVAPHVLRESLHPAMHAVVGTVAGVSAIPAANRIVSQVKHRKKQPAKRPSTQSAMVAGRDNHPVRTFTKMDDPSGVHVNAPLMLATGRKRKLKVPAALVTKADVVIEEVNPAEARRQLRRKKRQFGLGALATAGGVAALGGGVAGSKRVALPAHIAHRARQVGGTGASVAGVAGTAGALQGLQIQHHDLRQASQLLTPGR